MTAALFLIVCCAAGALSTRVLTGGMPMPGVTGSVADLRAALVAAGARETRAKKQRRRALKMATGCTSNCKALDTIACPTTDAAFGPSQLSTFSCDANQLVTELCAVASDARARSALLTAAAAAAARHIANNDDLVADLDVSALHGLTTLAVSDSAHLPSLTLAAGRFALRSLLLRNVSSVAKLVNVEQSARLQSLTLRDAPALASLALPPSLTTLSLAACAALTAVDLAPAQFLLTLALADVPLGVVNVTALTRLESLSIAGTRQTPLVGLDALDALQELSLATLALPPTVALDALLAGYRQLYRLRLDAVTPLTTLDLSAVAGRLQSLYVGHMRALVNITALDDQLTLADLTVNGTGLLALNVTALPLLNTVRLVDNARLALVALVDLPLLDTLEIADRFRVVVVVGCRRWLSSSKVLSSSSGRRCLTRSCASQQVDAVRFEAVSHRQHGPRGAVARAPLLLALFARRQQCAAGVGRRLAPRHARDAAAV